MRKNSLRDADGYIRQVAESTRESIRNWALFPKEDTLEIGKLKTYIVNCPKLHPLTSQSLSQHLERQGQGRTAKVQYSLHIILKSISQCNGNCTTVLDAHIQLRRLTSEKCVQKLQELVPIDGLQCPWCESQPFTQARLVEPLNVLDEELKSAALSDTHFQKSSLKIKRSPDRSERASTTSRSLQSSSSHSFLRTLQVASSSRSRQGSSDNATQSSPKGKRSSIFKSNSSSSRSPIFSRLFTDGNFVLAWTTKHVSCYDCELETWSKGHSFPRITWVAGSSVRYAVVSKDAHVS